MSQMFSRKDLIWFAKEIAPMIYPQDMDQFAKTVKAKSRNSRFNMELFMEVCKLSWQGRNSPHAQEDWLEIRLKQQYQEGKNHGTNSTAA
jgi:hypothetical protein|tara:strand:- start:2406 stop:2675 length:270 start_codon:yes stop_codon:yes gene_type:complete